MCACLGTGRTAEGQSDLTPGRSSIAAANCLRQAKGHADDVIVRFDEPDQMQQELFAFELWQMIDGTVMRALRRRRNFGHQVLSLTRQLDQFHSGVIEAFPAIQQAAHLQSQNGFGHTGAFQSDLQSQAVLIERSGPGNSDSRLSGRELM
ncbi:MAG: hypothetical protein JWQ23_1472 [Herminiimonas sp.]|nr:hypothetical protein [Herminiimonas sp.]